MQPFNTLMPSPSLLMVTYAHPLQVISEDKMIAVSITTHSIKVSQALNIKLEGMRLLSQPKDNLLPTNGEMIYIEACGSAKMIKVNDAQHANMIKAHTISSALSTAKLEMQSRTMQCTSCGLELTQPSIQVQ